MQEALFASKKRFSVAFGVGREAGARRLRLPVSPHRQADVDPAERGDGRALVRAQQYGRQRDSTIAGPSMVCVGASASKS
jgi:hypothetical protein